MSRSRALFQNLVTEFQDIDNLVSLQEWIDGEPPREDEILDYKSGSYITISAATDKEKLKQIWSEAVSGFANSSGGILIFGISTYSSGPDNRLPEKPALCFDLKKMEQNVNAYSQSCCDPLVQNIETQTVFIKGKDSDPEGILICHIPESPNRPHKALWAKNKDYYIRSQDGFTPCPHSILRSLFHSSTRPSVVIEFAYKIIPSHEHGKFPKCEWELIAINTSSVSLKEPTLIFSRATKEDFPDLNGYNEGSPRFNWPHTKLHKFRNEFIRSSPLHPNGSDLIANGTFEIFENGLRMHSESGLGVVITVRARDMAEMVFPIFEPHENFKKHVEHIENKDTPGSIEMVKVARFTPDAEGGVNRVDRHQRKFPSGRS